MPDDPQILERRLQEARARVDGATRGSPEWDAAMDSVEDLEARLAQVIAETVAA